MTLGGDTRDDHRKNAIFYCRDHALGIRLAPPMHSHRTQSMRSKSVLTIRKNQAISNAEFEFSALRSPSILAKNAEAGRIRTRVETVAYENRTKSAQSGGLERN